jgi:hypothetical protein
MGMAIVVPYDPAQTHNIIDWLLIAPRWERLDILREQMTEFIKIQRKNKRKMQGQRNTDKKRRTTS